MNTPVETKRQILNSELTPWEIGPYHSALPAPMQLRFQLDGELISSCQVETGFLHRGLEKTCELHSWSSVISYADHLDPEAAFFGELVVCFAVEEISNIVVPPRAQAIRIILSELSRVSAHLLYIVRMAKAVGSETIVHYVLRDRERILDLFELVTGARFSLGFLRFGGVCADVTDGFIERVLEVCEMVQVRMKEYNDLFTFNYGFLKRTAFVGVLPVSLIRKCGITGPSARASGLTEDIRKSKPYSGFQNIDFDIPIGKGEGGDLGDVHDRFLIRLREMSQSIEILRQISDRVPPGEFIISQTDRSKSDKSKSDRNYTVPPGEAYARVESARGLLGCHVVSDGKANPSRIQFRPPTLSLLQAIPDLLRGTRIEDLSVILASLDLGIAEADR